MTNKPKPAFKAMVRDANPNFVQCSKCKLVMQVDELVEHRKSKCTMYGFAPVRHPVSNEYVGYIKKSGFKANSSDGRPDWVMCSKCHISIKVVDFIEHRKRESAVPTGVRDSTTTCQSATDRSPSSDKE